MSLAVYRSPALFRGEFIGPPFVDDNDAHTKITIKQALSASEVSNGGAHRQRVVAFTGAQFQQALDGPTRDWVSKDRAHSKGHRLDRALTVSTLSSPLGVGATGSGVGTSGSGVGATGSGVGSGCARKHGKSIVRIVHAPFDLHEHLRVVKPVTLACPPG